MWQRSLGLRRRYSVVFSQDVSWQHWREERPAKKRQRGSNCESGHGEVHVFFIRGHII